MRQAIFILVLVGAAFLGGAFVNGPGLQWAKSRVIRTLGLTSGGEIAEVDLESNSNGEIGPEPGESAKRRASGPIAPMPSVLSDDAPGKHDAIDKSLTFQSQQTQAKTRSGSDQTRQPSLPSVTSRPSVTNSSPSVAAQSDQQVLHAAYDRPPSDSSQKMSSVNKSGVPAAVVPSPSPLGDLSSNGPLSASVRLSSSSNPAKIFDSEWALIESRMQTFGVKTFTIEGTPGGPVIFSCFIPVAGQQAVTERFEAEGENVMRAAQAALRRVVLWRATQPQIQPPEPVEKNPD